MFPKDSRTQIAKVLIPVFSGILLAFVYFSGVANVPFHPDESTNIFMSSDFGSYLHDPLTLIYRANTNQVESLRQHYRLIDAPLTRYIIGFGLLLQNQSPNNNDWNWSATWEENVNSGAVPVEQTLLASRIAVAGLFLFVLPLAYLIGRNMSGPLAGELILLLTGLNALLLLHTRRAMAEGALIFSVYLILWLLPKARKMPMLMGLAAGLAFCAKQSLLPLVGISSLAVVLPEPIGENWLWRKALINLLKFSIAFFGLFLLLNPIYWADPIGVFTLGLQARQELLQNQIADWGNYSLSAAPLAAVLYYVMNSFYFPPAFAEATNYISATQDQVAMYASQPQNMLMRNPISGTILLILFIAAIIIILRRLRQYNPNKRRTIKLYLGALAFQFIFIVIFLPIPWQRYVLPTIPLIIIFTGFGLQEIYSALKQNLLPEKHIQEQI